ncbi:hypothetical protein [Mangrovihabitans endophyticus]|uniref:Uncharacterized protein n=1 Tax=Mangrovihabitans endophyticus TaxID=1751298 RepID=A0A8J3BWW4_9ACTN|nr:hypothetical protein [Mangrovihabitans endophyticus]GGK76340.1 hypothetical protein GCM10012284_07840 [Mangrovihabitans endophyticus]
MIRRLLLLLATTLLAALSVPTAAAAAPDDVVKVAVVRTPEQNGGRPDTLDQIAQRTLGDPGRAGEILDLNRDRPQSDGGALTDSGEVHPGWILKLPDDAAGPDVRLGRVTSGSAPAADKPYFTWKLVLALVGAVILALVTVLVVFRRRIVRWALDRYRTSAENKRLRRQIQQQGRLRARLNADFAADQAGPELAWRAATDLDADRVEAYALRTSERDVTAWVTADHDARAPWRAESDGVWTRPAGASGSDLSGGSVVPCLVRVGGDGEGSLFVDLTWLDGVLAITGSPGVAGDVMSALLADLARFRPDLPVLSVPGLGGEPTGVPSGATRVRSIGDLRTAGPGAGADDGMVRLAARRRSLTALIVIADAPSTEEAEHLLAACGPDSGQVAVVLGDVPGAHWRWVTDVDGSVRVPSIDVTVTAPAR